VTALNEAGRRLSDARQQADQLARKIATGERLAAIGRVAAGVAHEIRDPIAAMRLKAENAMAGAAERKSEALSFILGQIERLDALLHRLLSVTERDQPRRECVGLDTFLDACIASHAELATAKQIKLERASDGGDARFDSDQNGNAAYSRAMGNNITWHPPRDPCGTDSAILSKFWGWQLTPIMQRFYGNAVHASAPA
jgi:signal transduction histidine kinase